MKTRSPARPDSGVALVLVLLVLTTLTLGSVMLMVGSSRSLSAMGSTSQQVQCRHVADRGIVEGGQTLPSELPSLLGGAPFLPPTEVLLTSGTTPLGGGSASYVVTVRGGDPTGLAGVDEQEMTVRSTCGFGQTQVALEAQGRLGMRSLFEYVACGCTDLDVSAGDAIIDAYDSALGAYAAQTPAGPASLGANGEVDVGNDAGIVTGSVVAGGDLSFDTDGTILGSTVAGGENEAGGAAFRSPPPRPCSCTEFDLDGEVAAAAASNDNASAGSCAPFITGTSFYIGGGDSCTFPSGTYYFTRFQMDNNASVTVSGPVTMMWDQGDTGSSSKRWRIKTNGSLSDSATAGDLQIFSRDDAAIKLEGNAQVGAYLYAPLAPIEVSDRSELFGAVVALDVKIKNDAHAHYDRGAAREAHIPGRWEPFSWKVARR